MPVSKKPTKKTVTKKPVKKAVNKKTKVANVDAYESFKLGKEIQPFWSFNVTRQTKYWIILLLFITVLQLVIIYRGIEALNIIDSISK